MNTAEAARQVGVTPHQLRIWHHEGWLTPKDNGRDNQGRRLDWAEKDIEEAKAMANQESSKSAAEAMIDSLGGQAFVTALARARALQTKLTEAEIVVAGPRGARIVKRHSLIEIAIASVGTPMILLSRDPVQ